jgi:hypothetical protein
MLIKIPREISSKNNSKEKSSWPIMETTGIGELRIFFLIDNVLNL